MRNQVINSLDKVNQITKAWTPKIIEQLNDYHIKVAIFDGDFIWHKHDDTDELFMVLEGNMTIHFRDKHVTLNPGDLYVVPKGVEHKPSTEKACKVLLIEPAGTLNTGDADSDLQASNKDWI
ncbi:cupin domain-containing protein [Acidaminobacter sp. JC074]|uniref:cupin domain-containing protein n=1 Tax=Acidaminobacter sp. JC074 TaxID=2530199 RepID=UPI001F0F61F0|nr:cupin domain-containing protein [Acidaminobacter sp. JC074]MCH4891079.1 cupin domain-containing protein [Acidaminobacter sp. JC074]